MRGSIFLVVLGMVATACGGASIDAGQSTDPGSAETACVPTTSCQGPLDTEGAPDECGTGLDGSCERAPSTTLPAPREVREVGDPPGVVQVSDDGTRLTLQWGEGGCIVGERLDVEETGERVVITLVLVDATPPPTTVDEDGEVVHQACTMILRQEVGEVTLAAPLGNRDVDTRVVVQTES